MSSAAVGQMGTRCREAAALQGSRRAAAGLCCVPGWQRSVSDLNAVLQPLLGSENIPCARRQAGAGCLTLTVLPLV